MGTIIDYLRENGGFTFEEKPFNEVDNLILSQFAYLKFDGMVPGLEEDGEAVTMGFLDAHRDRERMFADERFLKENTALYQGMLGSVRFSGLRLNYYENVVDTEEETQFSAVTLFLEDGTVYIAYRGTDETIVGWKEDFNLAFSRPAGGQLRSVEYLNRVGGRLTCGFYAGGHSKGGNFAVYAAMNCRKDIREKILRVYSNDGPGFRPEVRKDGDYEGIRDRVVKIIPHSSLVGLLLEYHAVDYTVVESRTLGLLQHNPFTWLVKEDSFVRVKEVYRGRRFMDETLNEWILSLDDDQIHSFVETLYEVVSASEAATLIEFTADWKKNVTAVVAAAKGLDGETASMMKKIVLSLFELAAERAKDQLQERAEQKRRRKRGRLSRPLAGRRKSRGNRHGGHPQRDKK